MTQAFNLSQFANKVDSTGKADLTTAVTGTLPVANGGTGVTSPGASGNILTSNGTSWASVAQPPATGNDVQVFNSSGMWTKPSSAPSTAMVLIEVISGGGSGGKRAGGGGGGGLYTSRIMRASDITGTVAVTVGSGGAAVTSDGKGNKGEDSTFGSYLSSEGGGYGGGGFTDINGGSGGSGGGGSVSIENGIGGNSAFSLGGNGFNGSGGSGGCGGGYGVIAGNGGYGVFCGGGGGGGVSIVGSGVGGNTQFGGAGGGGGGSTSASGGVSKLGGNGGAGNAGTSGVAGTAPGGGGGGTHTGASSGAGANGRVTITTYW